MTNRPYLRPLRWLLFGLMLAWSTGLSFAQTQRELLIERGRVYLDGRALAPENLPASLQIDDVTLRFQYAGGEAPVLEIGGRYYRLGDFRLEEVAAYETPGGLFFGPLAASDSTGRAAFGVPGQGLLPAREASAERLLAPETGGLPGQPAAAGIPHVQMQRYFEEVAAQDQELYRRLVEETQLENLTYDLGRRIALTPPGPARDQLRAELHQVLGRVFDLKQQNRRREIAQLEQQLDALRQRVREREANRETIIQGRAAELVRENAVGDQVP